MCRVPDDRAAPLSIRPDPPPVTRYRSKTLATWAAVLTGVFGGHRFYMHGWRDPLGWLHPLPTLAGVVGVLRMRALGQDDRLSWLLAPILGLMIALAMLAAIVHGLTPDERWDARHNPGQPPHATGWGPVIGVVVALMVGAVALTSAVAFGGLRFFEWLAGA